MHAWINSRLVRRANPDAVPTDELVSVLIPARNEAHRIGPTITSILATTGAALEIIVLDDASTDGTSDAVTAATNGDDRVRIVKGEPLPATGWLGKPYACQQLGLLASGSVLAFVDADVTLSPAAIRASVELLRRHELSLVSPYPKQIAVTGAESLMQPMLQWLWLTFLPLRLAERPRPISMAAANGQLLVVDAAAYLAIGGHSSVADEVIEDVALARAMKKSGRRATVAEGSGIVECRMYNDWPELRDGYSKSLWAAVQPRAASRAVGILLALAYLVPPVAFLVGSIGRDRRTTAIGAVGTLGGIAGRVISAQSTGGRVRDSISHPLAVATLLGLGRRSHRLHGVGALTWKGRSLG